MLILRITSMDGERVDTRIAECDEFIFRGSSNEIDLITFSDDNYNSVFTIKNVISISSEVRK